MTTAEQSRREMIATRKDRSVAWRVIHTLGSLKLALLVLASIAISIGTATFYENIFGTKLAHADIYKSWWFTALLVLLCANLFAVTLTRWPWQRKHLGFVVTHYGIITLLAGAMIGSHYGFEGNVTLHKGGNPLDRITTSRSMVQIESPSGGGFAIRPFDATAARPSEQRPVILNVPGSDLKIVADAHSQNLLERKVLAPSDAAGAPPGLTLDFASGMMGQKLSVPLLLGMKRDFFGLADIEFLAAIPTRPSQNAVETRMVFAKFAPVGQSEGGSTGARVLLSADGETLTISAPGAPPQEHHRAEASGKTLRVGIVDVEVSDYWPDFKLENGRPVTLSDKPNNPAVLVRLSGPAQAEPGKRVKPLLEIERSEGAIAYQLSRDGRTYSLGFAKNGEPFALGWADWKATVAESLPHAKLVSVFDPGPEKQDGIGGFRARLRAPDGREGPAKWVTEGSLTPLTLDGTTVRVGYGLELRPAPFTIALKNFEVPRNEGTEEPSNFISTVEFRDKKTGKATEGVAQMNQPASWPGGMLAVSTGLNYKFSQAGWNPQDLGQTTLQVLYDPGWMLKWMGSLAICAGIFIMFYLKPQKS